MVEGFERVAVDPADISGPPFPVVEVAGRQVVLVRTGDGVLRAFPNTCPHLGQPLGCGELHDTTIECPAHFYAYDLVTGANTFPGDDHDLALQVFEVREEAGSVFIGVDEDTPQQPTTARPPS